MFVCARTRACVYECMFVFCTAEEKSLVDKVFTNAIDCLSDEDKKLPQVSTDVYVYICTHSYTLYVLFLYVQCLCCYNLLLMPIISVQFYLSYEKSYVHTVYLCMYVYIYICMSAEFMLVVCVLCDSLSTGRTCAPITAKRYWYSSLWSVTYSERNN